jgi:hypothetical protein
LDCLDLAEDPLASNLIYLPKYIHIFRYFTSQDMQNSSSACCNTIETIVQSMIRVISQQAELEFFIS